MYAFLVFLACCAISLGANCRNLSGIWRNQLGSNMTLIHRTDDRLTGEYNTAVVSRLNAAAVATDIVGSFRPVDEGALVSFTVLFNRGKSLTTWVGQCSVCDGEEVLFTTWTLRSYVQKKADRWMSTHHNQDTFYRVGDEGQLQDQGPFLQDEVSSSCRKNIKAGSKGQWVSDTGDSLDFDNCYNSGIFSGVNRGAGVSGRSQGTEPFTALGFHSSSEQTVRGWVGHIYEGHSERKLETSWLKHSYSSSCQDPRSHVTYGMTNYIFNEDSDDSSSNSIWRSFG